MNTHTHTHSNLTQKSYVYDRTQCYRFAPIYGKTHKSGGNASTELAISELFWIWLNNYFSNGGCYRYCCGSTSPWYSERIFGVPGRWGKVHCNHQPLSFVFMQFHLIVTSFIMDSFGTWYWWHKYLKQFFVIGLGLLVVILKSHCPTRTTLFIVYTIYVK